MFKSKTHTILLLVIIITVLFAFRDLPQSFFQQDEWHAFGYHILLKDLDTEEFFKTIFLTRGFHYTPLTVLSIDFLFSLLNLNYSMYAAVSVILHTIASIMFFLLVRNILGNFKWAFLAMLLFGVSAAGFQATAWPIADIGTHGSTIFGFLSIILFLKFIKNNSQRFFAGSLMALATSLLFKENTVGFFVLLPVLIFLFGKISRRLKIKYSLFVFLVGLIYFSFRIPGFIGAAQNLSHPSSSQFLSGFAYNIFSIPLKSGVQAFIPSFQIYDVAHSLTRFFLSSLIGELGSPTYESFVLKRFFEGMNFAIFWGLAIIYLVYFRRLDKKSKKVIIFGALFILLNSLVFAFAPERGGIIYTIDSRNLYLIVAGTILILVTLLSNSKKQKLIMVPFFAYLILNVWWLDKQIGDLVEVGRVRKEILSEIETKYPNLPERVVFYTESDKSFYGLPASERILPFQSGFGQTLLVWYHSTQNFPKDFFRNRFLWEIIDQGYKEVDDIGFGYFRDFGLLAETVNKNKIPLESVIAFSYASQNKELSDISGEIQGRLKGFFVQKSKISQKDFIVKSSENQEGLNLALDNNRETFWDSKVPYKTSMRVDIEFAKPQKLAQIEVDSYTNKDQNAVGYEVFLSPDGKNWKRIFNAKRYTPDKNGITNIYFQPQMTRFLRLEQKGYHDYSPWVIHELNIYEAL